MDHQRLNPEETDEEAVALIADEEDVTLVADEEQVELVPDIEETPSSPPEEEAFPGKTPFYRIGFFQRITIHLILMIFAGGVIATTVMAVQLRRIMFDAESTAAFTVYTAASNYIAAHYRSHKGEFVSGRLDYVFAKRFMRQEVQSEGGERPLVTQSPVQLVIYDLEGRPVYEFGDGSLPPVTQTMDVAALQSAAQRTYDKKQALIHIRGSIAPEQEITAYLYAAFPTALPSKLFALYRNLAAAVCLVVVLTIWASHLFARRELAPIRQLTEAAHKVHHGLITEPVVVRAEDEIGELAITFNEMVGSLSRRISLLQKLQNAVVRIGRELESERLYQTLVQTCMDLAEADACRLYLYDEKKGTLEVRVENGGMSLPPPGEDRLAQMAFRDRWTQFMKANGNPADKPGEASEFAIPLLSGKHRVGVIRVGMNELGVAYDEETLTILHTLAQFASVAIENADLYSELAEKQRIEQEMVWARSIQESMLPRECPIFKGYELFGASMPANEVGGDYFDFVQGKDGRWHILIGDVSGKGVPAALIMSTVRSLVHSYLQFEASPEALLRLVNNTLSENLDTDMFVTLSTLCVEPGSGTVEMARAGHEPVTVIRQSGAVDHVAPPGAALGLLEVSQFDSSIKGAAFSLEHGDTVVLYTDGVTETQNGAGEEFGQEKLEAFLRDHHTLPVEELHRKVIHEVDRFSSGQSQHDDITLVVLRRNTST